jgi:uncharacterized protein (DUF1330 family)
MMKIHHVVALSLLTGVLVGAVSVQELHALGVVPPAYVVIETDVTNPDAYLKEFVPLASKAITQGGGNVIARGGKVVGIDGQPPKLRVVLISFNRLVDAQAAFASPAYRDARTIGDKYAKFRIWAIEGLSQ